MNNAIDFETAVFAGRNVRILHLDSVDSTNNCIKTVDLSEGPAVIISREQTEGRGTVGRKFFSPRDRGLYLSVGFQPEFDFEHVMTVTRMTGVALRRVLARHCASEPFIKPVNDIYMNGRKVAGILTESTTSGIHRIGAVYVGIGVNCFPSEFPEEIKDKAGCLITEEEPRSGALEPPRRFIENLAAEVLEEFFGFLGSFDIPSVLSEYERYAGVL